MLNFSLGGRGAKAPVRGTGSSFAHLMGLSRQGKASGEDQPDENAPPGEDDEDGEKKTAQKAAKTDPAKEDDAPEDEETPAAESSDPDETAEDDGTDEEAEDGGDADEKNIKKAKAAGFGPAIAAARRQERARCAAILGAPAAAKNVALAALLACETSLTPAQALRVMAKGGAAAGLSARMNAMGSPRLGGDADGAGRGAAAIPAGWSRAMAPFVPAK